MMVSKNNADKPNVATGFIQTNVNINSIESKYDNVHPGQAQEIFVREVAI